MRKTLVVLGLLGALGVLAVRLWPAPAAPESATRASAAEAAPPARVIALSGEIRDEGACAKPALQEIQRHPNWEIVLADREWDDVVSDEPDEIYATVRITAASATWTAGALPQTLELLPEERAEILAAAERSCVQSEEDPERNGFAGHYITLAYGARGSEALRLPGRSPAMLGVRGVMERIRARYVQSRLPIAQVMTVRFEGRRNLGEGWRRHFVVVHPNGLVDDSEGNGQEPLPAVDLVDVLDWAMQLPAKSSEPRAITGTIEIAGSKKPIAVDPLELRTHFWAMRNEFLDRLVRWGIFNERHGGLK